MKVKAKKSLGQNFLKDQEVIRNILIAADIQVAEAVLEIGPGTGVLTEALAEVGAHVVAIELDHHLAESLKKKFADNENVTIVEGDVLKMNIGEILEKHFQEKDPKQNEKNEEEFKRQDSRAKNQEWKIVANIPYYITAPIIRMLLSLTDQPKSMTLMVQDEVAERLTAKPGEMSLLSLMAQYYANVEKKFFVPKEAFEPVPQVDSAVVQIIPKKKFLPDEDKKIFRLARAGFAARRKTLVNNLASNLLLSKGTVEKKLFSLGLRPDIRGQALSVSDWERLQKIL